jgi:hypothetical protein
MSIEISHHIKIYPSHNYHFELDSLGVGGTLSYHEDNPDSVVDRMVVEIIHFRSPDEMEAVAKAMLKLAQEAGGQ